MTCKTRASYPRPCNLWAGQDYFRDASLAYRSQFLYLYPHNCPSASPLDLAFCSLRFSCQLGSLGISAEMFLVFFSNLQRANCSASSTLRTPNSTHGTTALFPLYHPSSCTTHQPLSTESLAASSGQSRYPSGSRCLRRYALIVLVLPGFQDTRGFSGSSLVSSLCSRCSQRHVFLK